MDIKGLIDTKNTNFVGIEPRFHFSRDSRNMEGDFIARIIIHVPDEWHPELYGNIFGEKVLKLQCFGDTWEFSRLMNSEKVGDTVAPCFYTGSMRRHFLEWEYDNGDGGYYEGYKREC